MILHVHVTWLLASLNNRDSDREKKGEICLLTHQKDILEHSMGGQVEGRFVNNNLLEGECENVACKNGKTLGRNKTQRAQSSRVDLTISVYCHIKIRLKKRVMCTRKNSC